MVPKQYSDEQFLRLIHSLEGEYDYSRFQKSPLFLDFMFLVVGPAAVLVLHFFSDLTFPPQEISHWVVWALIPSGIFASLLLRTRKLEKVRFHDGLVSFIDKSDAVTRAIPVSQITAVHIRNRKKYPSLRFTVNTETFDYSPPESLVKEILRDAKRDHGDS